MNREKQRKNEQAYRSRNAGRPRLSGTYLTEEESLLLKELAVICGSQKAAIFEGLKLLKEKLKK
ncbi:MULTISPECIES: hypothetical protein [unclassified Gilliamella]|jgi:hypothetical protein|uniref:hypothetical protein n=1 Tax=unclassified Gilliamella TaxID=2685620 RepID=UPI00080E947F|nr:hypothetical protein [Gilliamella apicola]OCG26126.1 hypothetical protein A9G46_05635 [Gilliamella apicola]OCG29893.1 hypothetical protein A9G45_03110 [Gilliamella apicola]OCG42201.1 hypothetical protein A9G29_06940 [Gilliamella apicola]OCG55733.1 hypothetical protein A9G30_03055 [Gilliamella apicola]